MKKILLSAFSLLILFYSTNAVAQKVVPQTRHEVELSFAPLVKKVSPAVVNIYTKKKVEVKKISPFLDDPMFRHFFGDNFGAGVTTERVESSLGSGVIVKDNGLIVTCYHVIDGASSIIVALEDRREFDADVVLMDEKTDLALLKINSSKEKFPYLELMDSDDLEVGDIVLAIGNPFGVGQTVTNGIVSALARTTVGVSDYQFFIQTDAAINPGNSGGALVNIDGKIAGINSAIYSSSGGSNGVGFAIPANMVATVIDNGGYGRDRVVRPWFGVTTQDITRDMVEPLGLDRPAGVLISKVYENGPADRAGIKAGDVVTRIGRNEVLDSPSLQFRIATYKIGDKADLQIIRDGKPMDAEVIMSAPPETPSRDLRILSGNNPFAGVNVANLSPALADELGFSVVEEGVIVISISDGVSRSLGLQKRDIIRKVNDTDITSTKQLDELLAGQSEQKKWKISLQRGNRMLNIIWSSR